MSSTDIIRSILIVKKPVTTATTATVVPLGSDCMLDFVFSFLVRFLFGLYITSTTYSSIVEVVVMIEGIV